MNTPMTRGADWDQWRTFLAVIRQGSLSAAGRALDCSAATVGRDIEALEHHLDRALFMRSPTGRVATADALALVPHAEAMAAAALALLREASARGDGVRGALRITASEIVSAEVLPPILLTLRERHPQLVIELAVTNRTEDLLRRDADIAVRMVEPTEGALVARRVGSVEIGLFAQRRYIERYGAPATLPELATHTLIGFDRDLFAAQLAARAGIEVRRDMFALRCDNDLAQLAALRAGFGIGGCQCGIAARDSDLVAVLPDAVRMRLGMWLVMHSDQRQVPRIHAAYTVLREGLAAYVGSDAARPSNAARV